MTVYKILETVSKTSSTNDKLEILKKNKSNVILRDLLYQCYNPLINYYQKKIPMVKKVGTHTIDNEIVPFMVLLSTLSTRQVTGNSAIELVKNFMETFNKESQDIIGRVINRDMKCGFSAGSCNKVWENLIPEFKIALANKYEGKEDLFDGTWYTSRKLDGCRCISIKEKGSINFFSRNGKPFDTLENLKKSIEVMLDGIDNVVLDGEVCITDAKGNDNFPAIMKEIKKKDHTIKNPKYFIFDYLSLDDFLSGESKDILSKRYKNLNELFTNTRKTKSGDTFGNLVLLEQSVVTPKVLAESKKLVDENGWEGLIVRKDTTYKGKRSNDLLKIKKFFDAEYKVKDIEISTMTFAEKGKGQVTEETMKSVIIEHEVNGKKYKVNVGSGFSREERQRFYKNPKAIIGKTITVQFFEQTKDKNGNYSLRFPTVAYIYENGRSI